MIYSFGCFRTFNLFKGFAFLVFKDVLLLLNGVLLVFFVFRYSYRFFQGDLHGPFQENNQKKCHLGQLFKLNYFLLLFNFLSKILIMI